MEHDFTNIVSRRYVIRKSSHSQGDSTGSATLCKGSRSRNLARIIASTQGPARYMCSAEYQDCHKAGRYPGPVAMLLRSSATALSTRSYSLDGAAGSRAGNGLGLLLSAAGGHALARHWAARTCAPFSTGARSWACRRADAWSGTRLRAGTDARNLAARVGVQSWATFTFGLDGPLRSLARPVDIAGQQAGPSGQTGNDQSSGNEALGQGCFHQCSPTFLSSITSGSDN